MYEKFRKKRSIPVDTDQLLSHSFQCWYLVKKWVDNVTMINQKSTSQPHINQIQPFSTITFQLQTWMIFGWIVVKKLIFGWLLLHFQLISQPNINIDDGWGKLRQSTLIQHGEVDLCPLRYFGYEILEKIGKQISACILENLWVDPTKPWQSQQNFEGIQPNKFVINQQKKQISMKIFICRKFSKLYQMINHFKPCNLSTFIIKKSEKKILTSARLCAIRSYDLLWMVDLWSYSMATESLK